MKFRRLFPLLLFSVICAAGSQAQGGNSVKKPVEYTVYRKLQRGEKLISLHSCMWLNEKNELNRLVIQGADNKYSIIDGEGRKDNLSSLEMYQQSSSDCSLLDPHKPRKATQYTGAKLVRTNANGTKLISAGNKSFGPFQDILFIEELGQRFVAVVKAVKNGKSEYVYVDSEGKQKVLNARPEKMIVNQTLTRAAVLLPPADAVSMEEVNKWSAEKKYEYFDQLRKKENRVWFNNDSTGPVPRLFRRLEYDVSGRHFLAVFTGYFFIDGIRINKDISAANTRIFAGSDPNSWVYWYQSYLGFSDGAAFQNVNGVFMTTENGKDYLNWFVVESNSSGDIIKRAKKEL